MIDVDGNLRGPVEERGPINNINESVNILSGRPLPKDTIIYKLKYKYFPTIYKGIVNLKKVFSFIKLLLPRIFNIIRLRIIFIYYKFFKYSQRLKFRWLIPFDFNIDDENINNNILLHGDSIIFVYYKFSELPDKFKQLNIFNFFTPNLLKEYRSFLIINGSITRSDGPAIIKNNLTKEWFINDQRHREDGPAFISEDKKVKIWFINDQRHREDGPAWINIKKNIKKFYLRGREVTEKEIVLKNFALNINFEN